MLVDSGTEISVISPEYEERMRQLNEKLPTLPLTKIHNAIGNQPY